MLLKDLKIAKNSNISRYYIKISCIFLWSKLLEITWIYFLDIKHLEVHLNKRDSFRFLIRNWTGTCRMLYRSTSDLLL